MLIRKEQINTTEVAGVSYYNYGNKITSTNNQLIAPAYTFQSKNISHGNRYKGIIKGILSTPAGLSNNPYLRFELGNSPTYFEMDLKSSGSGSLSTTYRDIYIQFELDLISAGDLLEYEYMITGHLTSISGTNTTDLLFMNDKIMKDTNLSLNKSLSVRFLGPINHSFECYYFLLDQHSFYDVCR